MTPLYKSTWAEIRDLQDPPIPVEPNLTTPAEEWQLIFTNVTPIVREKTRGRGVDPIAETYLRYDWIWQKLESFEGM
jgi:hypothetical protein